MSLSNHYTSNLSLLARHPPSVLVIVLSLCILIEVTTLLTNTLIALQRKFETYAQLGLLELLSGEASYSSNPAAYTESVASWKARARYKGF